MPTKLWTTAEFPALSGGAEKNLPEWADDIIAGGGGGGGLTAEEVRDTIAAFIVAGGNMTVTHDDAANTLTLASTGGGAGIGDLGWINVKDYGAVGDNVTDDTVAIQAALDAAFKTAGAVNGRTLAHNNKTVIFPAGRYKITSLLNITDVAGVTIIGAGQFATNITNATANGSVFVTNGFEYSRVEGMTLTSNGTGVCFDLSWDGTGSSALQSNNFRNMLFQAGAVGLRIGHGTFMGSESLVENCFFANQTVAGLETRNFNALQQSVIGGNFQSCETGILVTAGSVPIIKGVGFQNNTQDIWCVNGANDAMSIQGCRTESNDFIYSNFQTIHIAGCTQTGTGVFLSTNVGFTIDGCTSVGGNVTQNDLGGGSINSSEFGRDDWCSSPDGAPIYVSNVRVGKTSVGSGTGDPRWLRQGYVTYNAFISTYELTGSATYNPPSLADGEGVTTTVTVDGAVLNDQVLLVAFSRDLQGITLTGWVSATNTVSIRFQNESGGTLDLTSGTLRVTVRSGGGSGWTDTLALQTFGGDDTGWYDLTLRQEIPAAYLDTNGTQVRITLQNSFAAQTNTITHIRIAEQAGAGDAYDFSATPGEFLFGGVAGKTLTGASEIAVSDALTFTIDETKTYIISAHFSTNPTNVAKGVGSLGGVVRTWYNAGGDDTATVDATGYTAGDTTAFYLVRRIEVS